MKTLFSLCLFLLGYCQIAQAIIISSKPTSWYISQDRTIHTPSGDVTLRAGTPIVLEVAQKYSSQNLNVGQSVSIRAKYNVVIDKQSVIPAGAIGTAVVTDAKKQGIFGKGGKLELQVQSVQAVDGQQVQLSGIPILIEGDNKKGLAWGLSIGLGLFTYGLGFLIGFLIKGKPAEVRAGTSLNSTVASEVEVSVKR
jgi:hypothetical protein